MATNEVVDAVTKEPVPQPESLTEWVLAILPSPQVVVAAKRTIVPMIFSAVYAALIFAANGVNWRDAAIAIALGSLSGRVAGEGIWDAYRNMKGDVKPWDVTGNTPLEKGDK